MKRNSNLVIRGSKVYLVPYKEEHVVTYHQWMQDPYLQESTASDPLTLKEEFEMQKSWMEDDDKCTFILLDPDLEETEATRGRHAGMAGDVNLFFNHPEDRHTAEIEVMVAEPRSRGKGLALEALVLFMLYGVDELGLETFLAKIGFDNSASQQLFTKLGFREISRSQVFRETTFSLVVQGEVLSGLRRLAPAGVTFEQYA